MWACVLGKGGVQKEACVCCWLCILLLPKTALDSMPTNYVGRISPQPNLLYYSLSRAAAKQSIRFPCLCSPPLSAVKGKVTRGEHGWTSRCTPFSMNLRRPVTTTTPRPSRRFRRMQGQRAFYRRPDRRISPPARSRLRWGAGVVRRGKTGCDRTAYPKCGMTYRFRRWDRRYIKNSSTRRRIRAVSASWGALWCDGADRTGS